MLQNLRKMIMDKMQQKHHMNLKEQGEGFSDNQDTVHAQLERQLSSWNPGQAAVREQTPVNNHAEYFEHHQHSLDASQKSELSFDYNQGAFRRVLQMLDSDPVSLNTSEELTLGLAQEKTVSPDFATCLSLSLDDS